MNVLSLAALLVRSHTSRQLTSRCHRWCVQPTCIITITTVMVVEVLGVSTLFVSYTHAAVWLCGLDFVNQSSVFSSLFAFDIFHTFRTSHITPFIGARTKKLIRHNTFLLKGILR